MSAVQPAAGAGAIQTDTVAQVTEALSQVSLTAAQPTAPSLETAEGVHALARCLIPRVTALLSNPEYKNVPDAKKDAWFLSGLNHYCEGRLVDSLPIDGDRKFSLQGVLPGAKPGSLLRFMASEQPRISQLSVLVQSCFLQRGASAEGAAKRAEIIMEYVVKSTYADHPLPQSYSAHFRRSNQNVGTVQDALAVIPRMLGLNVTFSSAFDIEARQRSVIALVAERSDESNWVPLLKSATTAPQLWTIFSRKESRPLIGHGVHFPISEYAAAPLFERTAGQNSFWSREAMAHAGHPVQADLSGDISRQTIVVACTRLLSKSKPAVALQPVTKPPAAEQPAKAAEPMKNASQTVASGNATVALGAATVAVQTQAIAPVRAIPVTRVDRGAQVHGNVPTAVQDLINRAAKEGLAHTYEFDRESAELISIQLIPVRCPDTVGEIESYLLKLMQRIQLVKQAMLSAS